MFQSLRDIDAFIVCAHSTRAAQSLEPDPCLQRYRPSPKSIGRNWVLRPAYGYVGDRTMLGKYWRIALLLATGLIGCAANGCRSKSSLQYDRLDLHPPEDELKEFPLGEYKIPIPLVDDRAQNKLTRTNRFQF